MSDTELLPEVPSEATPGPVKSKRLVGYDLARCLAFFGMVIVNYRYLMGGRSGQPEWLLKIFKVFSGRAAATFVILAGIGMTLFFKAHKAEPRPRVGLQKALAPLRPIALVLLLSTSWIAVDFYVVEKANKRSFSFGPVARAPRVEKGKKPDAPVEERFSDHLAAIRSGSTSLFLKVGMGVMGTLLVLFLAFGKKFRSARGILSKRALFLAGVGYLWYPAWSFDILHFYAFYLLAGCVVLGLKTRWVSLATIGILAGAFWRQFTKDATEPFSWTSVWEGWGAAKNLFTTGIHPVLPWLAFLFVGICLGRFDSSKWRVRIGFVACGLIMAIGGHVGAKPLERWLDPERYTLSAPADAQLVLKEKERRKPGEGRRPGQGAEHAPATSAPTTTPSPTSQATKKSENKKKKGPPPPDPLPLELAQNFDADANQAFLAGVEKLRVIIAKDGPWKDRRLRVEEVKRGGQKQPALILSVSYG